MWSAAVDPRVLAVRAGSPTSADSRPFDTAMLDARILRGPVAEHLLITRGNEIFRLDVIEGTIAAGPVVLHFDLADDNRLPAKISAIYRFRTKQTKMRKHAQIASRLLALHAIDARDAGASLREIGDMLLGPGDWPGDGEHRKSLVRRLVFNGGAMIIAGPVGVMAHRSSRVSQRHP